MTLRKTVFAGNPNNQYGSDMILRESSDFFGQSIRTWDTHSVISGYFSHFRAEYNVDNNPTEISYFRGTEAYRTAITFVPAATLNNKYFVIHSAPDNQLYIVWYNVDGGGTAPVYPTAKFIEVAISASDSAEIVAFATKLTIDTLYSQYFYPVTRNGSNLEIRTVGLGVVDTSFDVNTGFTISGMDGEQVLVNQIEISYDGFDPIYNGQTLVGYEYDIYSGKFVKTPEVSVALDALTDSVSIGDADGDKLEVNPDGSINVNIVTGGGLTLSSQYSEVTGVAMGVTTEVASFTAASDSLLQRIEVSGTNIAEFELVIDGITEDKRRTYFGNSLNSTFDFNTGLSILTGQIVKIYVVHNRPDVGDFNARIQTLG